jgi:hypothetical protein
MSLPIETLPEGAMKKPAESWKTYLVAAVVALGLATAWGMAIVWISGMVAASRWRQDAYEMLYVTRTGEPVIVRQDLRSRISVQQEIFTLKGEPSSAKSQSLLYALPVSVRLQNEYQHPSVVQQSRLAGANDGGHPANYWYLIHDGQGQAYGVGYNSLTNQRVGYFTRSGFSDLLPPRDQWFDVPGTSLQYATPSLVTQEPYSNVDEKLALLANGKLWVIDTQEHTVRELGEFPATASLGSCWDLRKHTDESVWQPANSLILRTPEQVIFVDRQSGEQITVELPEDLRKASLSGYRLTDDSSLLLAADASSPRTADRVLWIDAQGRIERTEKLRLKAPYVQTANEAETAWTFALAGPFPLGQIPLLTLGPWSLYETRRVDSYSAGLARILNFGWPALLAVLAIGIASAVAAWRRQKCFDLPPLGWALFAFLLGLPGWIAYRFHRAWPVVEPCENCGQPAPRDRTDCIECDSHFPPPELKGIEIIA